MHEILKNWRISVPLRQGLPAWDAILQCDAKGASGGYDCVKVWLEVKIHNSNSTSSIVFQSLDLESEDWSFNTVETGSCCMLPLVYILLFCFCVRLHWISDRSPHSPPQVKKHRDTICDWDRFVSVFESLQNGVGHYSMTQGKHEDSMWRKAAAVPFWDFVCGSAAQREGMQWRTSLQQSDLWRPRAPQGRDMKRCSRSLSSEVLPQFRESRRSIGCLNCNEHLLGSNCTTLNYWIKYLLFCIELLSSPLSSKTMLRDNSHGLFTKHRGWRIWGQGWKLHVCKAT